MGTTRSLLALCGLSLGLVGGVAAEQPRAANKYAVVSFSNRTESKVNYYFRWGADSDWKLYTMEPGGTRWHWYTYDFDDQNRSPIPQVKFDYDLSDEVVMKQYDAEAYASPTHNYEDGKKYTFRYKDSKDFIDLYKNE
jgi:hypothetical protein